MMKNTAATLIVMTILAALTGCMGMRGTHKAVDPETGIVHETTFTYLRGGRQDIDDLKASTPENWKFEFGRSESQELNVGKITDIVVGILEEKGIQTE